MRYSPLRYPGGKSQLSKYVLSIIEENDMLNGSYVEAFAGGSGVALFLLLEGYMNRIYINDYDYSIYSFWYSIVNDTEDLCRLICDTPINMDEWARQKQIQNNHDDYSALEVGFSTFFLNRTNRSGIIKGGVMGGKNQDGPYKMDCRFNKDNLTDRIENIALHANNIFVSNQDAIEFLTDNVNAFTDDTFIYLDPPYYNKGQSLYINFYEHDDHEELSRFVVDRYGDKNWIITYDNTNEIIELYDGQKTKDISINYSAAKKRKGDEIIVYSNSINLPT